MKILVTGAKGFVGKNLIAQLNNYPEHEVFGYDIDTKESLLDEYTNEAQFVFHLAGVNRPKDNKEFMEGNFGFTKVLLDSLEKNNNKAPVLITSSIQAELDNPYGESKRAGENVIFEHGNKNGSPVYVYRLPNLFGKWCRPNYNSAVATFCNNIANDLPITVSNEENVVPLLYIDDLVAALISALDDKVEKDGDYCKVSPVYKVKLGEIVRLINSFKESRISLSVPFLEDGFEKKLYSTYLSYLPRNQFSYPLKMNVDNRGSFTEVIRTPDRGQVSVNISKPGITKGNHWHHTKNEKFLVVSGEGLIQFRNINEEEIIEYRVSGEKLEVVDIPPGYTHNIINVGDTDMVTLMWVNEAFDKERPDTFSLTVS